MLFGFKELGCEFGYRGCGLEEFVNDGFKRVIIVLFKTFVRTFYLTVISRDDWHVSNIVRYFYFDNRLVITNYYD